jgi:6-phosphogluconolactonase (cycloisomerase 2 family)/uncharacterized protein (DUF58 family)
VPTPATVTVAAVSQADNTKSGSATVTVTAPPPVTVTVAPNAANVQTGASQQFTATVANTNNTAVTWQVNGVAGGNATVGTISNSGLYTAPATIPNPATVTVTAVAAADTTKTGSATVTVTAPPPIAVTVSPNAANVVVGQTLQFTATVANTNNTAVTWQVNGVANGNSSVGTISATGLYTAPSTVPSPATVTVTAVSAADGSKSGSANVTVTAAPVITVTVVPNSANVAVNGTQQFTATVTGTANTAVTWQVNNVTGGNATVGTISGSGLYTAPASVPNPAAVTVKAISNADNTKSGTAGVTVTAVAVARFVYVSSFPDSKIAIFSVNDTTGLLNPTTTVSLPANSGPAFLGMHPSGKFLYSLNQTTNSISIFTVNSTTGALTAAGSAATAAGPFYMVFSPNGSFAYVTCDSASAVLGFAVNSTTGALTPVSGSPYAINGGRVRGIAISPDNKYLYVADRDATPSGISGFTINQSTGALTKMASSFSGDFIGTMIVDKAGKFLYAGSPADVNVSGYSINASTGALTFVADYAAGTSDTSVWTFDPTGTYIYGGSTVNNKVFGFKQNTDGSLTAISGMPVSTSVLPNGGGVHPNGKFAYVVSTISETTLTPGVITIYSINQSTGAFTQISSTPTGVNNTIGFAITP